MCEKNSAKLEEEALKFLDRDFNQCFNQMRYYDGQIWDICKFSFTAYSGLLGISMGLYQYSLDKNLNLVPAAILILLVGFFLGIFACFLMVRNRVYFVKVARYINLHRKFFLGFKPLGFKNCVKMYDNPKLPLYFDFNSSQLWLIYLMAVYNSVLIAVASYFYFNEISDVRIYFLGIVYFIINLIIATYYLRKCDKNICK